MRNLISSPYEISVWEDIPITEYFDEEGNKINSYLNKTIEEVGEHSILTDAEKAFNEMENIEEYTSSINYMEENMVAVIGSDGMDSPSRAFEPCLKRNINGTVTLSFYMFTRYYDELKGDFVWNPFTNLMTNERKLKLKYKDEWYDLIIKNIDEDSEKYTMTITATSLSINELAKTGFNITLDNELKNSIGTITELANSIVEGTDWSVAEVGEGTDLLEETLLEPLYEIHLKHEVVAENVRNIEDIRKISIPTGKNYAVVFAYYSSFLAIKNGKSNLLLIVYNDNGNYEVDEDNIIIVSEDPDINTQYYINNIEYKNNSLVINDTIIATETQDPLESDIYISYLYKGEKLVHNTYLVYDPIVEKVCTIYNTDLSKMVYNWDQYEIESRAESYYYACHFPIDYIGPFTLMQDTNTIISLNINLHQGDTINILYTDIVETLSRKKILWINSGGTLREARTAYDDIYYTIDGGTDLFKGEKIISPTLPFYLKFEKEEKDIYGYADYDYSVTQIVTNYVGDGDTFVNTEGWIEKQENLELMRLTYYPGIDSLYLPGETVYKYLCIPRNNTTGLISTTVLSSLENLEKGLIKGNKLVFKALIGYANSTSDSYSPVSRPINFSTVESNFVVLLVDYRVSGSGVLFGTVYCEFDLLKKVVPNDFEDDDGDDTYPYYYLVSTILNGLTQDQIKRRSRKGMDSLSDPEYSWKLGLFIRRKTKPQSGNTYLGSVLLFDYQTIINEATGNVLIRPIGSIPTSNPLTLYNYFYYPDSGALTIEDLIFLPDSNTPNKREELVPKERKYPFEKVRTVQGKQSNRFNLLLNLCETFECWLKFDIKRNPDTGKIIYIYEYDDDGIPIDKHQDKKVYFKKVVGEHNYRGFYYGTNLKSIKRTVESDLIVTKMIVGINSNEFGKNGYCTILRSQYNPIKEAFVLNLDYYIKQGMLDLVEFLMDLNTSFDGHLNYYAELNKMLADNEEKLTEYSRLSRAEDDLISLLTVYNTLFEKAVELKEEAYNDIDSFTADYRTDELTDPISVIKDMINDSGSYSLIDQSKPKEYYGKYITYDYNATLYDNLIVKLTPKKEEIHNLLIAINNEIEEEVKKKKQLESKFYRKYARFIQEGSWIDESYYDDDLYYLDAQKVLYDSAFPQVKYTISVLDLDELCGYENYKYNLGDITYVEDTEFFGYIIKDGLKTPYKEEVLISETTDYLDLPEKNVITIQNFKTQFEDLFQRITATTLSLLYASGAYDRTTSIMNLDGTINEKMLSDSLLNILATISNTLDKTTELGEDGILSKNRGNNNYQVKFLNGAIYTTRNGGDTWEEVLNPDGINISKLTAGSINTKEILIYSGDHNTFRWDGDNIVAYKFNLSGNDTDPNVDFKTYAAFNYMGLLVAKDEKVRVKAGYISETSDYGFALFNDDGDLTLWADSDTGDLSLSGSIYTKYGTIGNWEINTTGISGPGTITGANGNFKVDASGKLTATGASLLGDLSANTISTNSGKFSVNSSGILTATGATINGTIYATAGEIGGCRIENGELLIDSAHIGSLSVSKITGGENSQNITFSGTITCTNLRASGLITGGMSISSSGYISAGNLKIYESGGFGIIEYGGHLLKLDSIGEGYLRWGGWLTSDGLICDDIITNNISTPYVKVKYYDDLSHSSTLDAYDVQWIHSQRALFDETYKPNGKDD